MSSMVWRQPWSRARPGPSATSSMVSRRPVLSLLVRPVVVVTRPTLPVRGIARRRQSSVPLGLAEQVLASSVPVPVPVLGSTARRSRHLSAGWVVDPGSAPEGRTVAGECRPRLDRERTTNPRSSRAEVCGCLPRWCCSTSRRLGQQPSTTSTQLAEECCRMARHRARVARRCGTRLREIAACPPTRPLRCRVQRGLSPPVRAHSERSRRHRGPGSR